MIPTFKRTGFKYVTCHCKSLHLLSDSIVCQTDFLLIVFYIVNNHVKITLKVYSNFFSKTSFLNHFNSFHGKLNLSFINDQIVLFMCQTFICMYFDWKEKFTKKRRTYIIWPYDNRRKLIYEKFLMRHFSLFINSYLRYGEFK